LNELNAQLKMRNRLSNIASNTQLRTRGAYVTFCFVFENWVLRRIFGPKRHEVTGNWRKLHNEELHNLYSSPNTIRMIKSRRVRWAGHVARMGKRGMHIGY
jgi:hypothetical protein